MLHRCDFIIKDFQCQRLVHLFFLTSIPSSPVVVPLFWNPLTVSFAPLHIVSSRRSACMIRIPTLDDDAARTLGYDQCFPSLLSALVRLTLVAVSAALESLTVSFAPLHTVSSRRNACMIQIPT